MFRVLLALESQRKGSNAPSVENPVVNEERMDKLVIYFPRLGSVL